MNTTPAPQPAPQARPATWLRALLVAVLVAALATLGGLANAGSASADTGASFEGCPQLDEGDTGPCVAQLQQKLTKVHPEYNLPGTESFGPATRIALLDFQGRNHLGADGRFGTTTARELDRQYAAANVGVGGAVASPRPAPIETTPKAGSSLPGCPQLDLGDTDPCVAQLQQLLNKVHPEYKLPGSQTYGPKTQAAVADFQERNHITGGNGQFGPGTASALQYQAEHPAKATPVEEKPQTPSAGTTSTNEQSALPKCGDPDLVINQYTGECQSKDAGKNDGGSGAGETAKVAAQCTYKAFKYVSGVDIVQEGTRIPVTWKGKKKDLPKVGSLVKKGVGFVSVAGRRVIFPGYIIGCTVFDPTNK